MGQKHRAKLEMTKQLVAQHPLSLPEPPGHMGEIRKAENQPRVSSSRMGELQKSEQERARKRRGYESILKSGEGRKGIKRYT
jgi:hypothetical protein